jgi:5'(3')-deoxyribonucleotidase
MATIFLDMDGVVADFDGYAEPIVGYKSPGGKRYNDEDWDKISADPRLYSKLPMLPDADRLVKEVCDLAKQHKMDVKFLSAIPRYNNVPWVFWDKIKWIEKHWPKIPVWFGPYSADKQMHYQPGDILIDDRDSNIEEWRSRGGKAILHEGDVIATLFDLRNLVNSPAR